MILGKPLPFKGSRSFRLHNERVGVCDLYGLHFSVHSPSVTGDVRSNAGVLAYPWLMPEDQGYEQSSEYNSLKKE